MIEWILQANSTVTTTVFQQTSGAPFLGISATELITAITAVLIALFTGVTVVEGWKNRRKDSIEKQLERLYSPVFEILDQAESQAYSKSDREKIEFFRLPKDDCIAIRSALANYGHYLKPLERDSMRKLVSLEEKIGESKRFELYYFVDELLPT